MQHKLLKRLFVLLLFLGPPGLSGLLFAQTYTGDNLGAGVSETNPTTVSIASVPLLGVIGAGATLDAVDIDITHTFDSDLDISLVSPSGTVLNLSDDNGGSDDNYTLTTFSDGAGTNITAGSAPFTGTFAPEGGTFAATFAGECITGDWELRVTDDAGGDTGTLNNFQITFTTDGVACPLPYACMSAAVGYDGDSVGDPIPQGGGTSGPFVSNINVPVAGVIGVTAAIESVELDLTHTFDGDLDISLVSPGGVELNLSDDNGSTGDDYTGTVFEDGGADITLGSAPFTGTFEPEGGTFSSAFDGESIMGDWELRIIDDAGGDSGTFLGVTLNICTDGPGPPMMVDCQEYVSADVPQAIDSALPDAVATVEVTQSGIIGAGAEVDFAALDITHTFDGDMDISLVSPANTSILLSDNRGGSENNFTGTVFEDGGASIALGSAPFTGTFEPDGGTFASAFAGEQVMGTWSLIVDDVFGGDNGTLNSFTLGICVDADPCAGEMVPPTVACLNTMVDFNGEAEITVNGIDLYDDAGSSDACGDVTFLGPATVDIPCTEVGNTVMVTVEAVDDNGNVGSCTAEITVGGLPCDWIDSGGIGCGGSAAFDAGTDVFMVTGSSCGAEFPYTEDEAGFIYQELCGDSEIIAEVTGVTGSGFAGVMMRETLAPNAKKASIGTNTVSRVRYDYRIIAGYPAFPQEVISYDKFWVRLERTGNSFKGFASDDGSTWYPFLFQNIPMDDCILVGLFTYGKGDGAAATGTFENVSISGDPPMMLGTPGNATTAFGQSVLDSGEVQLFPNPTSNEVSIKMASFMDQRVEIQVFNSVGQLVDRSQIDNLQETIQVLDVSRLTPGLYLVKVKTEGKEVSKKLMIER